MISSKRIENEIFAVRGPYGPVQVLVHGNDGFFRRLWIKIFFADVSCTFECKSGNNAFAGWMPRRCMVITVECELGERSAIQIVRPQHAVGHSELIDQ